MQNIWKYSLVLAFSIILDQLFKGSAQSLVDIPNSRELLLEPLYLIRSRNADFIFNIKSGLSALWTNRLSLFFTTGILLSCFWWTVKWRNRRPMAGWSLCLVSCGFFSSFMDRYSHGYSLDYLGLKLSGESWLNFSLGDIEVIIGVLLGLILLVKRKIEL